MAYTQDQARQILSSGQGSPDELAAANAAYYGASAQGGGGQAPGGGGFYGAQTQQSQQPMPGSDNGALGYNNPGSQFYTPNQSAAPFAQGFAGASNDPGQYTTPDYIKNLNQNSLAWQSNQGNAAGFGQNQFNDAWQQYMATPGTFNPDAFNQAMGITNANGTEKIYRNGQQVGNGQLAGQSGQGQYWGPPAPATQTPGQGPQAGGNGSSPAPNPQAPSAGGMGMGQMPGQAGGAGMGGQFGGQSGQAPQTGQAGGAGMGGQMGQSNPMLGSNAFTQNNSYQNWGGGNNLQGMNGLQSGAQQYNGSLLTGQNPLSMPGNMGGVAQLNNRIGGYNNWGNPSEGNPFSYMTGQPGVRGENRGPQQFGGSSFGQGSNQNFYNPVLQDHNVRG